MMDKITITVKRGEDEELSLSFPEDIELCDMVDNLALVMRWLTWPQSVIESGIADYLVDKGWGVNKDDDDSEH